ncbi:acyltransferase family protein [soil metagenome]
MVSSSDLKNTFRYDINALRAIAVLSVIAYHFGLIGAVSGYIGVDVFFVISGYLIGGQVSDQIECGRFDLSAFMVSRIRRILPALVFVIAAVYIWGWFYLMPNDYKSFARTALWALSFVSNIGFAGQQGYFDLGAEYKPLLHTWSLSVEAQFYLVLPFLLYLIFKLRVRMRRPAVALLAVLSFFAALILGSKLPDAVFFSFSARAWEFLIGCLAAYFSPQISARFSAWGGVRSSILGVAWIALLSACFLLPKNIIWPGPWTLIPTALTAIVIIFGTGMPAGFVVRNRAVQHVGKISYSLYLWHWPIFVCWNLMVGAPLDPRGSAIFMLLAATWALAFLSWRFVELPFRANRQLWTGKKLYGAYATALVTFAAVGIAVWGQKGIVSRLPAYVQGAYIASQWNASPPDRCSDLPRAEKPGTFYACDVGDPKVNAPSFAIWGDSHSRQYLESLRGALDGSSIAGYLFHQPGCEPLVHAGSSGCDIHNDEVLQRIEQTPSIRTVVLAIRHNDPPRVDRTRDMARLLLEKNYRVIFLGPLPEAKRPVPQQWAASQLLYRKAVTEISVARDAPSRVRSFNERLDYWRKATAPLTATYPNNFVALDLTDAFCDQTRCWVVRDGVGLLRDADHLTLAGANRALGLMLKALIRSDG